MSWKDCFDNMKAGMFFSLKEDKESAIVMFLDEPFYREGEYQGTPKPEFCFPLLTDSGMQVWTRGADFLKDAKKDWDRIASGAVKITRNGAKGSKTTVYTITKVKMPAWMSKSYKAVTPKLLADLVEGVINYGKDGSMPF